jgi:hypothetical protein
MALVILLPRIMAQFLFGRRCAISRSVLRADTAVACTISRAISISFRLGFHLTIFAPCLAIAVKGSNVATIKVTAIINVNFFLFIFGYLRFCFIHCKEGTKSNTFL